MFTNEKKTVTWEKIQKYSSQFNIFARTYFCLYLWRRMENFKKYLITTIKNASILKYKETKIPK